MAEFDLLPCEMLGQNANLISTLRLNEIHEVGEIADSHIEFLDQLTVGGCESMKCQLDVGKLLSISGRCSLADVRCKPAIMFGDMSD
jgi:hypothetical protein